MTYVFKTIPELPNTSTLSGSAEFWMNDGGLDYRVTTDQIASAGSSATVVSLVSGEALVAPALVNITSGFTVVYADGSMGLPASGFITSSVSSGVSVNVYSVGVISGLSGLTEGPAYLSTSVPGGVSSSAPAALSGDYVQIVGTAISSSRVLFVPQTMNGPV